MLSKVFTADAWREALEILRDEIPLALWAPVYVTVLATLFAVIIGLPLGVLLVAGENNKIIRVP